MDFGIFVQADTDTRLQRRLSRDIVERAYSVQGVLTSYHRFVKPCFEDFIKPYIKYSDMIVPMMRDKGDTRGEVAINFICMNLEH